MKASTGILGLIAIVVLGYALNAWCRKYVSTRATGKAPSCLAMLGNTTREEEGRSYIIGSIKNKCDYKFSQVTVLFKLDREPGPMESLPEGIAYAYSSDVEPGETREFKTALPISKNATYRFDGINA